MCWERYLQQESEANKTEPQARTPVLEEDVPQPVEPAVAEPSMWLEAVPSLAS